MFEPLYTAACEQIAPDEALCARVLDAMHTEAEREAVLPLPSAARDPLHTRRLTMLVACAAVALTAAVIALSIWRQPTPPKQSGEPLAVDTTTTSATWDEVGGESADTTTAEASTTSGNAPVTTTTTTTTGTSAADSTTGTTTATAPPDWSNLPTLQTAQPPQPAGSYEDIYAYWTSATTTTNNSVMSTTAAPSTSPSIDTETSDPTTAAPSTAPSIRPIAPGNTIGCAEPEDSPLYPYGGKAVNQDGNTCQQTGRDGDTLYFLSSNSLLIYQLDGTDSSLLCSIPLDLQNAVQTEGFLVSGDRLAMVYTRTDYTSSKRSYTTFVHLYDISSPSAPRQIGEFGQDGYYRAARVVNGVLYLISYHTPAETPDSTAPASFIPSVYQNGTSRALAANDITMAKTITHNGYTVITALSMDGNGRFLSEKALFGQRNHRICVTDSAVMILSKSYTQTDGTSSYPVMDATSFTLASGQITAQAVITLRGESEYAEAGAQGGFFYIAPSCVFSGEPYSTLYVLNGALALTGKLEGLPKSLFTGMAFNGGRLYLCQKFEIMTVDIRNPSAPRLINQMTQTGAIERVWPYEDGLLLAKIGYVRYTSLSVIKADDGTILHKLNHYALLNFDDGTLAIGNDRIYAYDTASGFTQLGTLPDGVSATGVTCDGRYLYLNVASNSLRYGDLLVLDRQNGYQVVATISH